MKGWILYNDDPYDVYELDRLQSEAPNFGIELEIFKPSEFDILVNREDKRSIFINGERRELPDFVWSRSGASTTYFQTCVLRQLERIGVLMINPSESISLVKDKFHTQQILTKFNIPTPKTMFVKYPVNIDNIEKYIGFPCILKVLSGSQGKGVFLAKDKEDLTNYLDIIDSTNGKSNYIVQEFVKDSYGKDLRVYVIGGRVIGVMKRQSSNDKDFRANISNGGSGEQFQLTDELEMMAIEIAKITNLDIAGIDVLFSENSWKICEVNSNPGFKGFENATGINIPEKIFNYIKFKLNK